MKKINFKNTLKTAGFFFLLFIAISQFALAQSLPEEYTGVREIMQNDILWRDFSLQGEYLCVIENTKKGLQLVANGDGKFRCVFYNGGLPGAGWNTRNFRMIGTAFVDDENNLKFEIQRIDSNDTNDKVPELPLKIDATWKIMQPQRLQRQGQRREYGFAPVSIEMKINGQNEIFNKTQRSSETFNSKTPKGAVVIFDGRNVKMFLPDAKINKIQESFGNTLWAEATSKPFEQKPYTLHVEFMLSYMPTARGQARSNSGVYINESYECQVLDSFGLELRNNECGALYVFKPSDINMCFPPLTWQTYDIDFMPPKYDGDKKVENARVNVKHNGVMIHYNVELQKDTPFGKPEANEPRGVYLQGHGNKVQYRNIWLKYND